MKLLAWLVALLVMLTACERGGQPGRSSTQAPIAFSCPAGAQQIFAHAIDGQERYCAVIEGDFAGSWHGGVIFSGEKISNEEVTIQSISATLPPAPQQLREDINRCAPNCYGVTSGGGGVTPEDKAALEKWAAENNAACPKKEQERVIMPFTLDIAVSFCQEIEGDYVFVGEDMVVRGHYEDGVETGLWTYTSRDGKRIKERNYDQ